MALIFLKDEDNRTALGKARRHELLSYAQANGIEGVDDRTPARILRKFLRERGLTSPPIPPRRLGMPDRPVAQPGGLHDGMAPQEPTTSINADDAFEADWKRQQRDAEQTPLPQGEAAKTIDDLSFMEMRQECKRRGIPWALTDKKVDLKAKLHDQDPA